MVDLQALLQAVGSAGREITAGNCNQKGLYCHRQPKGDALVIRVNNFSRKDPGSLWDVEAHETTYTGGMMRALHPTIPGTLDTLDAYPLIPESSGAGSPLEGTASSTRCDSSAEVPRVERMTKTTSNQPPDVRLLGETSPPLSTNSAGTRMNWPHSWPSLEHGRNDGLALEAASIHSKAALLLQTASGEDFAKARELQQCLGTHPERWLETMEALLTISASPSDPSRVLDAHLLFSPQAPASPAQEQLRQGLRRGNCSCPSQAGRTPGTQR